MRVSVRVTFFFSAYSRARNALPFLTSTVSMVLSRMRTGAAFSARVAGKALRSIECAVRSKGDCPDAVAPAALTQAMAVCQ